MNDLPISNMLFQLACQLSKLLHSSFDSNRASRIPEEKARIGARDGFFGESRIAIRRYSPFFCSRNPLDDGISITSVQVEKRKSEAAGGSGEGVRDDTRRRRRHCRRLCTSPYRMETGL